MKVEFAPVYVARHDRKVSGDAYCVGSSPFLATITDAHGSKEKLDDVAALAQIISVQLEQRFSKDGTLQNAELYFDAVQEFVENAVDFSGLSAVATSLLVQDRIFLAQAGDVRLYGYDREAFEGSRKLTRDHNPDHPDEENRLQPYYDSGKFVAMKKGLHYGGFDLRRRRLHIFEEISNNWSTYYTRVTRGFGNQQFRPAFTHKPQSIEIPFDPGTFPVYGFCSDGGNKIVKKVFHKLKDEGLNTEDPNRLAEMAQAMIDEAGGHPKNDVTIIFFRIAP